MENVETIFTDELRHSEKPGWMGIALCLSGGGFRATLYLLGSTNSAFCHG